MVGKKQHGKENRTDSREASIAGCIWRREKNINPNAIPSVGKGISVQGKRVVAFLPRLGQNGRGRNPPSSPRAQLPKTILVLRREGGGER